MIDRVELRERLQPRWVRGYWQGLDFGDGWLDIVADLDKKLSESDPEYRVHQIKEKFGELRFYTGPLSMAGHRAVREAERLSVSTCEVCGQPGTLSARGAWWRTVCEQHGEGYAPLDLDSEDDDSDNESPDAIVGSDRSNGVSGTA